MLWWIRCMHATYILMTFLPVLTLKRLGVNTTQIIIFVPTNISFRFWVKRSECLKDSETSKQIEEKIKWNCYIFHSFLILSIRWIKKHTFYMFVHVLMLKLIRQFLCKYSDTCWVYRVPSPNSTDYGVSNIIHCICNADKTTEAFLNLHRWCSTLSRLPETEKFKVLNPYLCTQAMQIKPNLLHCLNIIEASTW